MQHFAVTTHQTKNNMSILLKLLKTHKPLVDYETLPSTGKALLVIDGNDVRHQQLSVETQEDIPPAVRPTKPRQSKKRPPRIFRAVEFGDGGSYIHFGIETAILGDSPGLYFKDANIIQFAHLNKISPDLIPKAVKEKVAR